jgi:hypothetical protein
MIPRRERPPVDGVRDGIPRRVRDGGGGAYPTLCFRVLTARAQRVALALVIAGCGGGLIRWHRIDPPPVGRRPPNQRLQIWSGREAVRWRAVVIGRDSVSGIPDPMPITCDSCRRSLPLTDVDSILRRPNGGEVVLASVLLTGLAVWLIYHRGT